MFVYFQLETQAEGQDADESALGRENLQNSGQEPELEEKHEPESWEEAGNWFGFNDEVEKTEVVMDLELCEAFYLSYALGKHKTADNFNSFLSKLRSR